MSRDRTVVEKLLLSLRSIGNFELEPLRQDQWGACFKAVDPNRRIAVSIKTCWPPSELLERYKEQASAAQQFDQPNIARAIGSGDLDGAFFTVTSYVHGASLRDTLKNERLNTWDLIDLARQVTLGLDYAHSRHVVHRALHPGNIVLEHDGATQILDFGWHHADNPSEEPLTPAGFYLAPEQFDGHPPDRISNYYSLALMLYEVATGRQPFRGDNWAEVYANAEEPITPAIEINPAVSPGINTVIMRALARDRGERYHSGAEFLHALEDYKSLEKPAAPVPVAPPATSPILGVGVGSPRPPVVPPPAPPHFSEPEKPRLDPRLDLESEQRSRIPDSRPSLMSLQDNLTWNPPAQEPPEPEEPFEPVQEPPRYLVILKKTGALAQKTAREVFKRVDPWVFVLVTCVLLLVGFLGRTLHRSLSSRSETAAFQQAATPTPTPESTAEEQAAVPEEELAADSGGAVVPTGARPRPRRNARGANAPLPFPTPAPVANPGSVAVTTIPSGAQIAIDGKPGQVFTSPQTIDQLAPGVHTLTISKAGYQTASRQVMIVTGTIAKVAVQLNAPPGYLTVTSNPSGAYIVIDGRDTTRVTPSQVPVSPGAHTLTVRRLGYLEENVAFNINSGEQQSRGVSLLVAGNTPDIKVLANRKLFGSNKVTGVKVSVVTQPPGARITVNGQEIGRPSPVDFSLNPGNYVFNISADGYRPIRRVINIQEGQPVVLNERLQP